VAAQCGLGVAFFLAVRRFVFKVPYGMSDVRRIEISLPSTLRTVEGGRLKRERDSAPSGTANKCNLEATVSPRHRGQETREYRRICLYRVRGTCFHIKYIFGVEIFQRTVSGITARNMCNVSTSDSTNTEVVKEITQAVFPIKHMTA
jgi:hypothetical protein